MGRKSAIRNNKTKMLHQVFISQVRIQLCFRFTLERTSSAYFFFFSCTVWLVVMDWSFMFIRVNDAIALGKVWHTQKWKSVETWRRKFQDTFTMQIVNTVSNIWMPCVIKIQMLFFLFQTAVPSVTGLCSTFDVLKQCIWPRIAHCLGYIFLCSSSSWRLFSLEFSSSLDHIQSQLYSALTIPLWWSDGFLSSCWSQQQCRTGQ